MTNPDRQVRPSHGLILASASPRRRELLEAAGIPFEVHPSDVEERTLPGETPRELARRLAREKARDVADRFDASPSRPVLGADTIVVADGDEVLGKPRDEAHAVELLGRLMGRTHRVMTGVALIASGGPEIGVEVVTSEVEMRSATREELVEYVAVGESLDKAGGYALQGAGRRFVVSVKGSESNVIGLPIDETLALLARFDARLDPKASR